MTPRTKTRAARKVCGTLAGQRYAGWSVAMLWGWAELVQGLVGIGCISWSLLDCAGPFNACAWRSCLQPVACSKLQLTAALLLLTLAGCLSQPPACSAVERREWLLP